MVKFNKKAAVELSLNLIIMLVIGLTILGLIIAFVTSFLGSAEDSFKGKLTEDDKTKIDQVKREPGEFAFLSSTLNVKQGAEEPAKLYVKIRNINTGSSFLFPGGIIGGPGSDSLSVAVTKGRTSDGSTGNADSDIEIYAPPIDLESAESDGFSLEVYAKDTASPGTYYATFTADLGGTDLIYNEIVTINVE